MEKNSGGLRQQSIYGTTRLDKTQIRLLLLLPGGEGDPIQCTVHTVDIASSNTKDTSKELLGTRYEALSYVWASQEEDVFISVNDLPFKVTANLNHALTCIRLDDKTRLLWIDAICINQQDDLERSSQVCIMDQIYGKAETVVVFLGSEADDSALVLNYLTVDDSELLDHNGELFLKAGERLTKELKSHLRLASKQENMFLSKWFSSQGLETSRIVRAAYSFFCRPYWRRMWVVQEVRLAQGNVVWFCGRHSVSMARLRERLPTLHNWTMMQYGQGCGISLESARKISPTGRKKQYQELFSWSHGVETLLFEADPSNSEMRLQTLSQWLDICSRRDSGNPLDRVYAILSMLQPSVRSLFIPDYSISTGQLFTEVTQYLLATESDTRNFSSYNLIQREDYPSWTLDYSNPLPEATLHWYNEYNTSYWIAKKFQFNQVDSSLALFGIEFDEVQVAINVHKKAPPIEVMRASRSRVRMIHEFDLAIARPYIQPLPWLSSGLPSLQKSSSDKKSFLDLIRHVEGLRQVYKDMLEALFRSDDELPGAIAFICKALQVVATQVTDFEDNIHCHNFQSPPMEFEARKALLRLCMKALTQDFMDAALFDLQHLLSTFEALKLEVTAGGPAVNPSIALESGKKPTDTNYNMISKALNVLAQDLANSCHLLLSEHVDEGKCSDACHIEQLRTLLAAAYVKTTKSLHEALESCECETPQQQEAHHGRIYGRLGEIAQERLMFDHVLNFLWIRRKSEYTYLERLESERDCSSTFLTRSMLVGYCFQDNAELQEDDVVVVMNGVLSPMVLRKNTGRDDYKVMGVAYISGLADVDFHDLVEEGVLGEELFLIT